MNLQDLKFLIYLLDDEDPNVYNDVSKKIVEAGKPALSALEDALGVAGMDTLLEERLEWVINRIQYTTLLGSFKDWLYAIDENKTPDLLKGCSLIASYQYPDLDQDWIKRKLNRIYQDLSYTVSTLQTGLKSVSVFNRVLFDTHDFSTPTSPVLEPNSFFINRVLGARCGHPIVLSIIYLILARRLGLRVHGVNFGSNLLLAYPKRVSEKKRKQLVSLEDQFMHSVKFYIDPAKKGTIYMPREINTYLQREEIPLRAAHFTPCLDVEIIKCLVMRLADVYSNQKMFEEERDMKAIAQLMEEYIREKSFIA